MSDHKVSLATVLTIIGKGLLRDSEGVRAYAELLAENAEKDGDHRTAEAVRGILKPLSEQSFIGISPVRRRPDGCEPREGDVHVYPDGHVPEASGYQPGHDLRGLRCWCDPEVVEKSDIARVIVHNAKDVA